MRAWALVLTAFAAAACVQAWGIDELRFDATGGAPGGAGGTGAGASGGAGGETPTAGSGGEGAGASGAGGSLPSCGDGYVCVPTIEAGSYVTLVDEQAGCPSGWSDPMLYAKPEQPGCAACACDDPPPGTCTPTLHGYDGSNCGGQDFTATSPGCFASSSDAFRLLVWASSESCQPTGGGPAPFQSYTACTLAAPGTGSCAPGMQCVPEVAGTVCNLLPVEENLLDCAAGYLPLGSYAELLADERECGCSCSLSLGQSCDWEAVAYEGTICTGVATLIPNDNTCTGATATHSVELMAGSWSGGVCTPNAAPVPGEVSFGPAQALCCLTGW